MRFIDIYRDAAGTDCSSLSVSEPEHTTLRVLGVIPHGSEIQPRSVEAAQELIKWLEGWILNAHEAALRASVASDRASSGRPVLLYPWGYGKK